MPKVKVKRKSTFIDMTAMSDVTVLLLTFFMLTSTFIAKEPVQVQTPASVSDIKIPDVNIMTVIIEKTGQLYMSLDNQDDRVSVLEKVGKKYNIEFTNAELIAFKKLPSFGVPLSKMKEFLNLAPDKQDAVITSFKGIPYDSANNQFKAWVESVKETVEETGKSDVMKYAIKSDSKTPYSTIKEIMNTLQEVRIDRYNLITTLKTGAEE